MLVRKKKSLSMIVLFGIALFVFSFTIPKPQLSRRRIYDKTKQKSFKTTTSLWETSQERRRLDENRGNLNEETKRVNWQQNYSQVPTQNHGKAKTLLQENRSDKTTSANGAVLHSKSQPSNTNDSQLKKRFPTVIILGVKKAGTRALLEILRMHPNVIGAPNEVYFFNGFHTKGLEWYRQQMPLSSANKITIEKSPTYFTSVEKTQVVNRMFIFSRSMPGSLKLLVVVRDPAKRCLSEYTDLLARSRKEEIPTFNDRFENLVLHDNGSVNANSELVKTGLYIKHLKVWLGYFPPNEIHFVSGEGLVRNPYKEVKAVEKFLQLRRFFTEKNFRFIKKKGFPCFVPDISKRDKSYCLPPNKGRKHVDVQHRTLELLRQFYRPYNEQFYKAVRRNFFWS